MLTGEPQGPEPPVEPGVLPNAGAERGNVPATLTEDGFLGGQLRVLQPEKGFRAGIDAVFLAAAVPCLPGQTAFEAGIGAGVAALCLAKRVSGVHITGVEQAPRYALMCEENAKRNGLGTAISVIQGDIKQATRRDLDKWPPPNSFNHVYANPPFFEDGRTQPSPVLLKAAAQTFGPDDLEAWLKVMIHMAVPRGTITVIHRPESLGRILNTLGDKAGDIRLAPLHVREGDSASRIIVQGVKASRAPTQILRGLVLHSLGSSFTPEAEAILRDGLAYPLR